MVEESGEQEYQVESIVTHLEYVEAFELRGYIVFNPSTGNGSTHSKFVYLVKWVGYEESENTWEPEENLVDCTELLTIYKQKHGLPLYHETFNRRFNWKEPTTSMTLAEVNRRAFKNRDPITSASQLVRDPPTKRKRRTKSDLDDPDDEQYTDEDDYTPRRKSKSSAGKTDTPKKRGPKKRTGTESATSKRLGRKPRAIDITEERKEKGSDAGSGVELVRYILEGASHRSRSPVKKLLSTRRYSSAERLPERWLKAVEESAIEDCVKMTREKLAKMFTAHFVNSTEEFCDRRKMIVCMREKEQTSADNEQRQYRVVGSSLLKKLLKESGIANKLPFRQPITTPEKVASPPSPVVAPSEKTSSCLGAKEKNDTGVHSNGFPLYRTGFSGQECSVDELRAHAHESSLSDSLNFLKIIREKDVFLTDDELLVTALSYAELSYKVTIRVLRSVAEKKKRLDIIKDLVENVHIIGNVNLSRPQKLEELSSSLASQLVESDLATGDWFEPISHCSAAHWKCRLLYQFIALCPVPEVFFAPSSPFNLKQFLYCMRYGAHCQKLAFIKCGVPFGQENIPFDYFGVSVDHCHIAAMQKNPRYLFEFIQNGFDVNSLTTKPSSRSACFDLTVSAFLEKLVNSNKSNALSNELAPQLTDEAHKHLINVIGIISDWDNVLKSFVRDVVEQKLRCDQRCEVNFGRAVSPVHILRVSSCQPDEISVRTTLFGDIPTPILSRIVNMVHSGKSAVVLCVYTVSVSYQPITQSSPGGCALPLRLLRRVISDCSVRDASLHDLLGDFHFALTPDESSSSCWEWYFVMDAETLSHISTNTMRLRLKMNAPPDSLFLAQFVVVTRKEFDDVALL
ncbi:hypothetical protein RB195_002625 [Necator americanus]|uniref:Chromo domain-containing protein n=1 Tax=Necator americanus TaxID=51031 RepID=A0ABR1DJX2_NECAM